MTLPFSLIYVDLVSIDDGTDKITESEIPDYDGGNELNISSRYSTVGRAICLTHS